MEELLKKNAQGKERERQKLENSQDKKKHYKTKEKKSFMSTWENLDDISFDEDEEANLCRMTDSTFEESE
ncbi:hypothetical protein JHK82_052715 [Glycine max]|nr:hypothetical protein JHK86_052563 [Glycine max]KAG4926925.1 hypothetical protein JHK85_053411 [Glycine max]KAG5082564.1 hypothetical protein JHK84_052602 [Glycine max]KAG5085318.1 hypothetical protein JHK82_052715 [Glycine max]